MIDQKVLEKSAFLARLKLTESEGERALKEMIKILKHFEELQKIDTKGVEPLYGAVDMKNQWRHDENKVTETKEELTEVLAERKEGQIKVPQVV